MKLNQINHNLISFRQANLNCLAVSDGHGNVKDAKKMLSPLTLQYSDIFTKQSDDEKGEKNIAFYVGDAFIDPATKGLGKYDNIGLSHVELYNTLIQKASLLTKRPLNVFATIGNHDIEGGDENLIGYFDKLVRASHADGNDFDVVVTNAKVANPALKRDYITRSKIIEVEDDRQPGIKHNALILGLMPSNIEFYCKGKTRNLEITDKSNTKVQESSVEILKETYEQLGKMIEKFKENNPDSPVILLNHAGIDVARVACDECPIDIVFNAHDHKYSLKEIYHGKTESTIYCLGENLKRMTTLQLHFADDGTWSIRNEREYISDTISEPYVKNEESCDIASENQELLTYQQEYDEKFNEVFKDDFTPIAKFKNPQGNLNINRVRGANCKLANMVLDVTAKEIEEQEQPINSLFIRTSSFRKELDSDKLLTKFEASQLTSGQTSEDGQIYIGQLSGEDLMYMRLENCCENFYNIKDYQLYIGNGESFDRGEIIKTLLDNDLSLEKQKEVASKLSIAKKLGYKYTGDENQDACVSFAKEKAIQCSKYVQMKEIESDEFKPIDLSENYTIAIPLKMLNKQIEKSLKGNFIPTKKSFNEYFLNGLKNNGFIEIPDTTIVKDSLNYKELVS